MREQAIKIAKGDFDAAFKTTNSLLSALKKVIRGKEDTLKLVLTALLAKGHVLIEDYPGSGKTTLAKTLGSLISSDLDREDIVPFRRIQFTPDLLPGDVLGVNIFEAKSGEFKFIPGPVFAHVVLADEINRTGPKVQAAFLECMAEKQVTLDNYTHKLDRLFFVIGTQNPLDLTGTYPLPLVQLDRFLLKIPMSYVDRETEIEIINEHENILNEIEHCSPVCSRESLLLAQDAVSGVELNQLIREAIVDFVQESRTSKYTQFGLSTRAAIMLKQALQAWAIVQNRDYVTEDDFKQLTPFVCSHRLKFQAGAGEPQKILDEMLSPVVEKLISSGLKDL